MKYGQQNICFTPLSSEQHLSAPQAWKGLYVSCLPPPHPAPETKTN